MIDSYSSSQQTVTFLMRVNSINMRFLDDVKMSSDVITKFMDMTTAAIFDEPTSNRVIYGVRLDTTGCKMFLRTMSCCSARLSE